MGVSHDREEKHLRTRKETRTIRLEYDIREVAGKTPEPEPDAPSP